MVKIFDSDMFRVVTINYEYEQESIPLVGFFL